MVTICKPSIKTHLQLHGYDQPGTIHWEAMGRIIMRWMMLFIVPTFTLLSCDSQPHGSRNRSLSTADQIFWKAQTNSANPQLCVVLLGDSQLSAETTADEQEYLDEMIMHRSQAVFERAEARDAEKPDIVFCVRYGEKMRIGWQKRLTFEEARQLAKGTWSEARKALFNERWQIMYLPIVPK